MISIIVPVYKSEKTLERCIDSILTQTYRNLEIIMVVDGPPDASGFLADRLAAAEERIHVIHQKNQGVSAARNAGMKTAAGEYLQFVDSDDYLEPEACEKMVCAMEENKVQMVIAGFCHRYYSRKIIKLPQRNGVYTLAENETVFLNLYETQFMNMPWNKLYLRALIEDGFPPAFNLGEDLLFNLSYLRNVKNFCILQEPVCNYIEEGTGLTLSGQKRKDRIAIACRLYEEANHFCETVFAGQKEAKEREDVLKSKVLVEFLDILEGLPEERSAAGKRAGRKQRLRVIQEYREAWERIRKTAVPRLELQDYKIIYYFFNRNHLRMTDFMIVCRFCLVQLLGKHKT